LRDLSNPDDGAHALQLLIEAMVEALARELGAPVVVYRESPIVSVGDNYDRLGYAADAVARDARYSRYLCDGALLRTHTTAMIPSVLRRLAAESVDARIAVCPGMVYRRDAIDRRHSAEPHQVDVWWLSRTRRLGPSELDGLLACLLAAALPGRALRTLPAAHPYTEQGREIQARDQDDWLEVGECGLAAPALLAAHGLADSYSGLAVGLGLDRLLMIRKQMSDIRLLRARDVRIQAQMQDLAAYRAVSAMPAVRRDLSLVLDAMDSAESLGERVRQALGVEAEVVESVEILAETAYDDLPEAARARLGIASEQRNALVRLVLRAYERTLTASECNLLRDRVYQALHRGTSWEWALGAAPG
jgi:phenylalanyl-tRNA synthetase alpha chain